MIDQGNMLHNVESLWQIHNIAFTVKDYVTLSVTDLVAQRLRVISIRPRPNNKQMTLYQEPRGKHPMESKLQLYCIKLGHSCIKSLHTPSTELWNQDEWDKISRKRIIPQTIRETGSCRLKTTRRGPWLCNKELASCCYRDNNIIAVIALLSRT